MHALSLSLLLQPPPPHCIGSSLFSRRNQKWPHLFGGDQHREILRQRYCASQSILIFQIYLYFVFEDLENAYGLTNHCSSWRERDHSIV